MGPRKEQARSRSATAIARFSGGDEASVPTSETTPSGHGRPLGHSRPGIRPRMPLFSDLPAAKCVTSARRSGDTCCRPRRAESRSRVWVPAKLRHPAGPYALRWGNRAQNQRLGARGCTGQCAWARSSKEPGARGAAVRVEQAAMGFPLPGVCGQSARAEVLTCQYPRIAGIRL